MSGDTWIVWTVRLSLSLLTAGLAGRAGRFERPAAVCWALGAATMWTHLAAAFAFEHGWSHADAVRETARQTRELVGLNWGGGVWANYLFALVWTGDAAWRLARSANYFARSAALDRTIVGFLGFIAFNGAVVFADGPTRWIGLGCCGLLLLCGMRSRRPSE